MMMQRMNWYANIFWMSRRFMDWTAPNCGYIAHMKKMPVNGRIFTAEIARIWINPMFICVSNPSLIIVAPISIFVWLTTKHLVNLFQPGTLICPPCQNRTNQLIAKLECCNFSICMEESLFRTLSCAPKIWCRFTRSARKDIHLSRKKLTERVMLLLKRKTTISCRRWSSWADEKRVPSWKRCLPKTNWTETAILQLSPNF